ncbi:hypothetical protein JOD20_001881 [Herpetosiphon giganteus]|nr:hypothetical protein [Herpetosiphon giganteus]MBM7843254.1 hypothetical protein [Herpetosiphon giganteus]
MTWKLPAFRTLDYERVVVPLPVLGLDVMQ